MKKNNNSGFMLAETLIVATFLVSTLLFIYIQFNGITNKYDDSFKYNTVNGLYTTKNIIKYISNDGMDYLKDTIDNSEIDYINITDCPNIYFTETNYCSALMSASNVKTILFTKENLDNLKNITELDQTVTDFINNIDYEVVHGYRLIIEFNDGTFASLKI